MEAAAFLPPTASTVPAALLYWSPSARIFEASRFSLRARCRRQEYRRSLSRTPHFGPQITSRSIGTDVEGRAPFKSGTKPSQLGTPSSSINLRNLRNLRTTITLSWKLIHRALPSDHFVRLSSSYRRLSSSPDQLPSSPRRLPSSPDQLPSSPGRLLNSSKRLPNSPRRLPNSSRRLPSSAERLPNSPGRLSNSPRRLPNSAGRLSSSPDRLPTSLGRPSSSPDRLSSSFGRLLISSHRLLDSCKYLLFSDGRSLIHPRLCPNHLRHCPRILRSALRLSPR